MILLPPPPPARIQVVAREYSLALSRPALKAGPAIVELANFGEDPHDLRLRRAGGTRTYAIAVTQPGAVRDLRLTLLRGRYTLWCGIGDHRERGMVATLRVTK